MRIQEIHTKQWMNYKKAVRLVKKGQAEWVTADRRHVRYVEGYERILLDPQMRHASTDAKYERTIEAERGGKISGQWRPTQSGKRGWSGPGFKTVQYQMTTMEGISVRSH